GVVSSAGRNAPPPPLAEMFTTRSFTRNGLRDATLLFMTTLLGLGTYGAGLGLRRVEHRPRRLIHRRLKHRVRRRPGRCRRRRPTRPGPDPGPSGPAPPPAAPPPAAGSGGRP